jgi:IMP cyclohydrolase
MEILTIKERLQGNSYPGRGIITGLSSDGEKAVLAYFIMGRSVNSRNRVFVKTEDGIETKAFDEKLLSDPSLIIYSPVRKVNDYIIVTNGDQTDTIYDGLKKGFSFEQSLRKRTFEPDGPNYTPRISSVLDIDEGFKYQMSILKSDNGNPDCTDRYTFYYDNPIKGEGRFLHTYMKDADVLPSFEGEPERVFLKGDIDEFTNEIWDSLNNENKISLYTVFVNLKDKTEEYRLINKNI